jgi:hypothetical protein
MTISKSCERPIQCDSDASAVLKVRSPRPYTALVSGDRRPGCAEMGTATE